jgi:hypothetical protein
LLDGHFSLSACTKQARHLRQLRWPGTADQTFSPSTPIACSMACIA